MLMDLTGRNILDNQVRKAIQLPEQIPVWLTTLKKARKELNVLQEKAETLVVAPYNDLHSYQTPFSNSTRLRIQ